VGLSISSSLPIFVMGVASLSLANGVLYSLATHRMTFPSRRYCAYAMVIVLFLSCGVLSVGTARLYLDRIVHDHTLLV
jgi:hypothetical protein